MAGSGPVNMVGKSAASSDAVGTFAAGFVSATAVYIEGDVLAGGQGAGILIDQASLVGAVTMDGEGELALLPLEQCIASVLTYVHSFPWLWHWYSVYDTRR